MCWIRQGIVLFSFTIYFLLVGYSWDRTVPYLSSRALLLFTLYLPTINSTFYQLIRTFNRSCPLSFSRSSLVRRRECAAVRPSRLWQLLTLTRRSRRSWRRQRICKNDCRIYWKRSKRWRCAVRGGGQEMQDIARLPTLSIPQCYTCSSRYSRRLKVGVPPCAWPNLLGHHAWDVRVPCTGRLSDRRRCAVRSRWKIERDCSYRQATFSWERVDLDRVSEARITILNIFTCPRL